ncbi:MAG: hypothetical protein JOZ41_13550, partial [Chloroflexi bacterium]|nr:hypothetical protein [Chloroflexota bacterium]
MLRRLIIWISLILASVIAGVRLAGTQIAGAPGPASQQADARTSYGSAGSFVRVETSTPVVDVLYRWGQVDAASGGAYGPNATAPRSAWFLEYQRAGAVDVVDGVLRHDPGLVEKGLQMFHFGLARQAPDGSFPGSAWPFHGTALFLSEAAPSLVVLRSSDLRGQFAAELAWEVARMRRAAQYMVQAVGGPGMIDDSTKNHRYFEAAVALGAVGVLSQDTTLERWSTRYARRGIAMERPDGVMPEDGGHDSGYQALGMVDAARYLSLVARGRLYASLYAALQRGEDWELSRIGPDGSVGQVGDTRTAGCKERDP